MQRGVGHQKMRFVSWLAHIWFWLRRVWTSIPQVITTHLFRTCIATTVAGIVAYLPFIVSAADALLWDQMGWWKAFGSSIEYGYHGGIAVAVTGCLCYFEHEAEVPLGPVAGAFASMSFLGCLALVIFFIVGHGHAEAMRDAFSEGEW